MGEAPIPLFLYPSSFASSVDRQDEGYRAQARWIAEHPEMGIYCRFSDLQALNLLYLQAELAFLKKQLKAAALRDMNSDDYYRRTFSGNWVSLSQPSRFGDETENEQWRIMLVIRKRLKEYNGFLLQQNMLSTFGQTDRNDLEELKLWLMLPNKGNNCLRGPDRNIWEEGTDLIAPNPRFQEDPLSRWICGSVVNVYHRFIGRKRLTTKDLKDGEVVYSDKKLLSAADMIGTVLASLLPVSSVIILYFVPDMLIRLVIVSIFTTLFSTTLLIMTKARRVEIFAATAAFASVQVVYVGSTTACPIK